MIWTAEEFLWLKHVLENEYTVINTFRDNEKGRIRLISHNGSAKEFIIREFLGDGSIYTGLIGVLHAGLPKVFEAANMDDHYLVIEEYIKGSTLHSVLQEKSLSKSEAKQFILKLCDAVAVLHHFGCVHRDIKPENIIITSDNELKLIDLHAACRYYEQKTSDTTLLGTHGYAAPEQYGISASDFRTDIYAIGITANVMLTGQHPAKNLAGGKPGRIIKKCIMGNPDDRYKDIQALRKEFSLI